jgi:hypothetical protein
MKIASSPTLPVATFAPKLNDPSSSVTERFVYKVTPTGATKPFFLTTPTSRSFQPSSQAQMDELQLGAQAAEILARFVAGAIADHFGPSGRIINNTIWLGISGIRCCLTIKQSKGRKEVVTQFVHVGEDALHLLGCFGGFEGAEMVAANLGYVTKLGKIATGGVLTPFEYATLTPRVPGDKITETLGLVADLGQLAEDYTASKNEELTRFLTSLPQPGQNPASSNSESAGKESLATRFGAKIGDATHWGSVALKPADILKFANNPAEKPGKYLYNITNPFSSTTNALLPLTMRTLLMPTPGALGFRPSIDAFAKSLQANTPNSTSRK